jgi:hypothetical protein
MWWGVIIDPQYGNNKVNEYVPEPDQAPVQVTELEDIPEFLKKKGDETEEFKGQF